MFRWSLTLGIGLVLTLAGNGLNVLKVMPESAIKFGSYEAAKRALSKLEGHGDPQNINPYSKFVAGGVGGLVSQYVFTLFRPVQDTNVTLQTLRLSDRYTEVSVSVLCFSLGTITKKHAECSVKLSLVDFMGTHSL